MLAGVSTGTIDAVLAWWADHAVTTEQFLEGGDLEGVHGAAFWGFLEVGVGSSHASVGDLVITDTGFVLSAGSTNLGVDIWKKERQGWGVMSEFSVR